MQARLVSQFHQSLKRLNENELTAAENFNDLRGNRGVDAALQATSVEKRNKKEQAKSVHDVRVLF